MNEIVFSLLLVGIPTVIIAAFLAFVIWRRVGLKNSMNAEEGFVSSPELEKFVGCNGQALTVLRPGGMVTIDGRRLDARAQGEFIEKGKTIRVIGVDGAQLVVDDIEPAAFEMENK